MTSAIIIGVLILALGIGAWLLIRWARKQDAKAREEAAKKTEAEIKVESAEVLDEEKSKSDKEAWDKYNENFPPGG